MKNTKKPIKWIYKYNKGCNHRSKKYLETEEIFIFVGPRQAGKTTILHQLEKEIKDKPYFFLNLEDKKMVNLLNLSPKNIF